MKISTSQIKSSEIKTPKAFWWQKQWNLLTILIEFSWEPQVCLFQCLWLYRLCHMFLRRSSQSSEIVPLPRAFCPAPSTKHIRTRKCDVDTDYSWWAGSLMINELVLFTCDLGDKRSSLVSTLPFRAFSSHSIIQASRLEAKSSAYRLFLSIHGNLTQLWSFLKFLKPIFFVKFI